MAKRAQVLAASKSANNKACMLLAIDATKTGMAIAGRLQELCLL
jgi:hypothetical protein